jgi:hypothetical protein
MRPIVSWPAPFALRRKSLPLVPVTLFESSPVGASRFVRFITVTRARRAFAAIKISAYYRT